MTNMFILKPTMLASLCTTALALALTFPACATAAPELIINGDFGAGNSGFTSNYAFSHPMFFYPGYYDISSTATPFGDHTTGTGNLMTVDGAFWTNPLRTVWQEIISTTPDTDYSFSFWARSINPGPIISLALAANGSQLGVLTLTNPPGNTWQQFAIAWNSEAQTSATFSIVNLQTNNSVPGNDFALDDISLTALTDPDSVPEPASWLLAGLGLAGLWAMRTRRMNSRRKAELPWMETA